MAKTSCKKGQYYCNTDKKCKPIPRGFTVREDGFLVREGWSAKYKKSIDCDNPKGFSQKAHCAGKKKKMTEESNPRIARKKGQPAKSKKHSDLYTDEDPKGTIHGLGFKDVATAKASVAKIRKSSRSHAHKIQAAIAMEQRARVMGKTAEAAVYRKFINSMKKKTKAMNEEKHGDHEYEMIRRQTDNIMVAAKKLKKKVGKGEGNAKAWVQSKITKAADYLDTAADYMTDKDNVKEGTLRSWFKGSKSKDGKGGWVNVKTGGTCASDEPGEGVPKCVSRSKYDSMSKKERESAHRRKRAADPNQQSKTGAAKPTYVSTDKPKKKKKMKEEFVSLPLQLEIPQNEGEFKLGLMFRESLEQDRGMLFIFENNDYHTFHMKNTFIPLDIAFIKEDGTIDSIEELDPMSPIHVSPRSEIRYAVEVNRGWFAENDVNVGDALLEEEELNEVKDKKGKGSGTKDACYYKVKSRYSVWPSAYASGALVKCRKVGAANWGNSKKEEVEYEYEVPTNNHYSWRDSLNEGEELDEMMGGIGKAIGKGIQAMRGGKKLEKGSSTYGKSGGSRMKGYSTYGKEWSNESPMKLAKKSYESGGSGETLTIGGRTRVISKKEQDDHKKKVMSTKATKYNTYARNTPYSRFMGYDHYVPTGDQINEKEDSRAQQMAKARIIAKQKEAGFNTTGVKGITKKGDKVFKDGRQLTQYGISQLNKKDGDFSEKGKERRALKDLNNRINEAPDSSMMKKPELHTRGGKTAPEPNTTQTAIKKVGQKLKDKFYEDTQINERTIAQKNSMQQRNKDAARARAQQMAKDRIAAKQKAAAPAPQVKQPAPQAAPRPQAQKPIPKAAAPAPQAKPAPQRAQTSVRTRGGGVQSAPKPSGLLSKIGSGIKRVAGGVADAATGNRFDFDKRGGQRPAPKTAGSGNVRGSGARANRAPQGAQGQAAQKPMTFRGGLGSAQAPQKAPQKAPQGQAAPLRGQQRQPQQGQAAPLRGQQRQPQQGQAAGTVTRTGAAAASSAEKVGGTQNIPASQKVTPTSSTSGPGRGSIKFSKGALTKLVGGGSGNTAQNNQSGGQRKPMSPEMQKRVARTQVGTNAAKEVQKVNPKPGQTVNVKQDPKTGSVSSKVTGKPTGDTSQVIGMDQKTGEKKLQNMKQKNKPFDDFDAEMERLEAETPLVNSKGKKVKKIPGTNPVSGGTKKQSDSVNQNISSF